MKIRKRIFKKFEERLTLCCSSFEKDDRYPVKESTIFKCPLANNLTLFILLGIVNHDEGFTLELQPARTASILSISFLATNRITISTGRSWWSWPGCRRRKGERLSGRLPRGHLWGN